MEAESILGKGLEGFSLIISVELIVDEVVRAVQLTPELVL